MVKEDPAWSELVVALKDRLLRQVSLHKQSFLQPQQLNLICFLAQFAFVRHLPGARGYVIHVLLASQFFFSLIFSHHALNSRGTRLPKKKACTGL